MLSKSQFELKDSKFEIKDYSYTRPLEEKAYNPLYETRSSFNPRETRDIFIPKQAETRSSFQTRPEESLYKHNSSPKSLSSLVEDGKSSERGRDKYKEEIDNLRKSRNMSSNGFEDRYSYKNIQKDTKYTSEENSRARGLSQTSKLNPDLDKSSIERPYSRSVTFGPDPSQDQLSKSSEPSNN